MRLFKKPLAAIYVRELHGRLDPLVVPIFTPDTPMEVGTHGFFEDGRFVPTGNVRDHGVAFDVVTSDVAAFDFSSAGKVKIGPSTTIPNPAGGDLVKCTISFTGSRAVIASFKDGTESTVAKRDDFSERLARAWAANDLTRDRLVVWSMRLMRGGTVIVSRDGDNSLDVTADAALLAAAGITIPNLSIGVTFGVARHETWTLSDPDQPLVAWVRLLRLRGDRVLDEFGFESGGEPEVGAEDLEEFSPDELLADLEPAAPQ
jgi:hypothetical protein